MENQSKPPVVITVGNAIVKGAAKNYSYLEAIVCVLHRDKKGAVMFRSYARPCAAHRSKRLAVQDARDLLAEYLSEGRMAFFLEDRKGSMHNCPVPPDIAKELLKTEWAAWFPSHPEIAQEFLIAAY